MQIVEMEEVLMRKTKQERALKEMHNNIMNNLAKAKKDFQKLDAKNLDIFQENLNVFSTKLGVIRSEIMMHESQLQWLENINNLQKHVDQGLRFQRVEVGGEYFDLQETEDGPKVIPGEYKDGINEDSIPF